MGRITGLKGIHCHLMIHNVVNLHDLFNELDVCMVSWLRCLNPGPVGSGFVSIYKNICIDLSVCVWYTAV